MTNVHAAGAGQGSNAFNPDIGLILNGTYGQFSHDPAGYAVSGFPLGDGNDPGSQGFTIGESELVYLAPTMVNLQLTQERWPDVRFHATREQT